MQPDGGGNRNDAATTGATALHCVLSVLGLMMLAPAPALAQAVEWTQRSSAPSARRYHAMAYDAARGVTVLFGGFTGFIDSGETWEWNGTAWTLRKSPDPSARFGHAMAYDAARGVTVLFGGSTDFTIIGETWELGGPCTAPSITTQPVAQTVCVGGPAGFTVSAAGTEPISYQWRKGSDPLVDEPNHISGVNAPILVIVNATEGDEGSYDCVGTNTCATVTSDGAFLDICSADFNCDGFANSQDFFDFIAAFFALQPAADFNRDTFINSQDFFDFLTAFFVGC